MRQHNCHRAAAWSAAGVPADRGGLRAERARACRVASGPTRRLPRCAAPRAHLCWHTRLPHASAAAHRRRPSLRRWLACARLATAERSHARSRGASARQCKAVSTTRSTSLCGAQSAQADSVTPGTWQGLVQMARHSLVLYLRITLYYTWVNYSQATDAMVVCIWWG